MKVQELKNVLRTTEEIEAFQSKIEILEANLESRDEEIKSVIFFFLQFYFILVFLFFSSFNVILSKKKKKQY